MTFILLTLPYSGDELNCYMLMKSAALLTVNKCAIKPKS